MAQRTQSHVNGVELKVLQDTVRAIQEDPGLASCRFRARNTWTDATRNRTTIEDFYGAKEEMAHGETFELHADEPPILAGGDQAPNPVEHLLNALASCLTTSMVAHAAVRGIDIQELESELEGDIDLRGFLGLSEDVPKGYSKIRATFRVTSDADPETLKSLAGFSPVFNTLTSGVDVDLRVEEKEPRGPGVSAEAGRGAEAP